MGYQRKHKRRRKRRHDEDHISTPVTTKDPIDDVQNALKNPALMKNPDTVLAMQSVIGNQAVQRALQQNNDDDNKKQDDTQARQMNERIEQYNAMCDKLEEVFPKQNLAPMLEMFNQIGFKPDHGFLIDIMEGKHLDYLPAGEDSVYALDENTAEESGKPYYFSDDVRQKMIRLEIIMSLFFPKDHVMQKAMENPVITVTGTDMSILGVTGLENSTELNSNQDIKVQVNEYQPLARFITLDQARKLGELDPEVFRVLLGDILPEHELEEMINALQTFLKHLKNLIARDQLLRQPEWQEAKLRGMHDKDSSSFDQVLLQLNSLPQ